MARLALRFRRCSATRSLSRPLFRGLKPTATITQSLRDISKSELHPAVGLQSARRFPSSIFHLPSCIRYSRPVLQRLVEQLTRGDALSDEQVTLVVGHLVGEQVS